jgi:hypothetical protein
MMTDWPDHRIDRELSARNPVRLEEVGGSEHTPEALAVLSRIIAEPAAGRPTRRHRGAALIAAAAVAAAVAVTAVAIHSESGPAATTKARSATSVPGATATPDMQLIAFTTSGKYIIARITNPLAASSELDAVFRARGFDISVLVQPVSPSLVGTITSVSEPSGTDIRPIQAGACLAGGTQCTVGLIIPTPFHGPAYVTVGRAAKPGEPYDSSDLAFSPGEALHCTDILNEQAKAAIPLLASKGLHPQWRLESDQTGATLTNPPLNYYVLNATPLSSTTVIIALGPNPYPSTNQLLQNANTGC